MTNVLTQREVQVLTLVVRGLTDKEIAAELGIARPTVSNCVSNVLLKLEANGRVEAAVIAITRSIVPPAASQLTRQALTGEISSRQARRRAVALAATQHPSRRTSWHASLSLHRSPCS